MIAPSVSRTLLPGSASRHNRGRGVAFYVALATLICCNGNMEVFHERYPGSDLAKESSQSL
jgi:hypothetical protein